MPPSSLWAELTTTDVAELAGQVAVLPVAATEQHGPHLPLGTDTFIMQGYLDRVRATLPADVPALFLPIQSCGASLEHADFPGTLSLSARTALAAWSELAASVARAGCRKLVVVNSHGGNSPVIDILAQEMRATHDLFVAKASWQRFGLPAGLFDDAEIAHGIHGGAIETSLMLALRPDLVRMDAARDAVPASVAIEHRFEKLRTGRPTGFGWMAQDLHASGVAGDATVATAAAGEACLAHGAAAFIALLRDVAAFDLAGLVRR
ncbi:Creatinine amidohydrolase [Beijerinckiaceae bacterium RH AL1]|nr:creatininase family protein [Beijerinckiaceae bacterium]VVB48507.1 Creatinine amidohydrolase [Beijerinckiaceae bacterium RH CH11]VVB48588.1 Creatinine amidohydrolase [Beijerinckiaceae bacterium RH AL8]VVC56429.1 Creatinine amidohydrolase [Beijerinckiaceae bacterium RH AL1]